MSTDLNIHTQSYIDDLPMSDVVIVVAREMLRALGLTGCQILIEASKPLPVEDLHETTLATLRAFLTAMNLADDEDKCYFALQHLQSNYSRLDIAFDYLSNKDQDSHFIADALHGLLAMLCANAYSHSADQSELLSSTIAKLNPRWSHYVSRYLRYGHDDLLLMVPPADRAFEIPLWADDDIQATEVGQAFHDWGPKHAGLNIFDTFATNPSAWSFWADWYQGFLIGKPLDWDLQRRVALIPDADWDQGPAHIATKIDEIKAAFLAEKLPLAETLDLNPDTGLFRVTPIPLKNAPLIGTLLMRVTDAVDDAVQGNNGLNANNREVKTLTRAAQRYGNDPQRLEMDFTSVAIGLRRQVHDTGELPNSEDNLALLEAVEEGARGLRAAHPDVAANRVMLAGQALRELTNAQRNELAQALPMLVAITEGTLSDDFAVDVPALINDTIHPTQTGAPRLPGMDPSARVFGRAAKISVWVRAGALAQQIDNTAAYKAAGIAITISEVVDIGLKLYGVL